MLARMPMIAITISSSMSVKPDEFFRVKYFCMTIPSNGKQRNHSISGQYLTMGFFRTFILSRLEE